MPHTTLLGDNMTYIYIGHILCPSIHQVSIFCILRFPVCLILHHDDDWVCLCKVTAQRYKLIQDTSEFYVPHWNNADHNDHNTEQTEVVESMCFQ